MKNIWLTQPVIQSYNLNSCCYNVKRSYFFELNCVLHNFSLWFLQIAAMLGLANGCHC